MGAQVVRGTKCSVYNHLYLSFVQPYILCSSNFKGQIKDVKLSGCHYFVSLGINHIDYLLPQFHEVGETF